MTLHPDLFGGKTKINEPVHSTFEKLKEQMRYRKTDSNHFRCGTCRHLIKKQMGNKNFYKCNLIGDTDSEASDIRLSSVCNKWDK